MEEHFQIHLQANITQIPKSEKDATREKKGANIPDEQRSSSNTSIKILVNQIQEHLKRSNTRIKKDSFQECSDASVFTNVIHHVTK